MFNTVICLTLVAVVASHDVIVGNNTEGRKIYDEVRHASPAIWRQVENVTITTTDAEVISRIVITDLRPDKDGDVKVVDGGEGQKNVTIEIKSPTVLRGYDFRIQVYSVPEDKFVAGDNNNADYGKTRVQRNPEEDQNKGVTPPPVIPDDSKKLPTANDSTPMTDDTKINEDKSKTAVKDSEDVSIAKVEGPTPFIGSTPEAINTPVITALQTGETSNDSKARQARDTLSPQIPEEIQSILKKTENKDKTKKDNSTESGVFVSRQDFDESTTAKAENDSDAKRNARETEKDEKSNTNTTTNENTQHPAILAKENTLSTTPSSSTNKPVNVNEGKRDAREAEQEKKSDSTTPKIYVSSIPTHPKISGEPSVDTTTSTQTPTKDNTTIEDQNDDRAHFVPPPGYQRVVNANGRRIARDVTEQQKPASPRLSSNAQDEPKKTNDASSTTVGVTTSTTSRPVARDSSKTVGGVQIPPYQPLPYSSQANPTSTTTKPQNKRDTESKSSGSDEKDKEDALKNVPRLFGEKINTKVEQKPVISIQ